MAEIKVNAKGMQCPGPIVEVFKAVNAAQPGDIIQAEATDRGFLEDIKAWCRKTGNELVSLEDKGSYISASVKKSGE